MAEPLDLEMPFYPSPVLRRVAEPIEEFDEGLERIVAAMYQRMQESGGVGLAAPQVGLSKRILVLNEKGDPSQEEFNHTLINPKIVARDGERGLYEEGCLSFPEIYAEIERTDRCTVEAQDLSGRPFRVEYSGFVSRIVQHEYDHLEGILLVDRMSPADRLRNKAALEELVERYKRGQSR